MRWLAGPPCAVVAVFACSIAGERTLAQQPAAPVRCRVSGRMTSGATPVPGVSILARDGDRLVAATSSDVDGTYRLSLPAGATYRLSAELTAFAPVERELVLAAVSCDAVVNVELALLPRAPRADAAAQPQSPPAPGRTERLEDFRQRRRAAGGGAPGPAGRQNGPRFEPLPVQSEAAVANVPEPEREENDDAAVRRLLPPGFSIDAPTDAVAIQGETASLDRGQLADRLQALGRGEFAAAGAFLPEGLSQGRQGGFGPGGGVPGFALGQFDGLGGGGGRAGGPGPGGRGGGGAGGRGGILGPAGRGQARLQGSSTYTFGGSALDAAPYALRAGADTRRDYARQQFGSTIGGPLRVPGVYDGARTSFFLNYSGGRSTNLVDRYATVPTADVRQGDFSRSPLPIVDPETGQPFPDNQIPADRLDSGALSLLRFFPDANLPGTAQNYHAARTAQSTTDNISVRVTHAFSGAAGQRGAGPGGRGGFGGRGGGLGPGGRAGRGTTVALNAQVQYRRNRSNELGVFPSVDGRDAGSSFTVPVALNVLRNRMVHNIQITVSRTRSETVNRYAGIENVAGMAGITGVASDPFDWGVPNLSFSTFTSLRDVTPSRRIDRRLQASYSITRPTGRHTLQFGGDFRQDRSSSQTDTNARGSFVFTGLYAAGGASIPRGSGVDFADFLLGLPQQASVQFGPGEVALGGRSFSLFAQDNWRKSAGVTFNLGVRYELVTPFTEADGRMVGLDVTPGFTAATPVVSGGTGSFTGAFPAALVHTDANNVAPRVGLAWRANRRTVLRTGYGVSFNSGSYASIARQLVAQPPFAVTSTTLGGVASPLTLSDPFVLSAPSTTTNTYGIDKDYQLGVVQTWNLDVDRDLGRGWSLGAGYTGTKGSHLDIVRAPNRDPDGLRIEGVQPFLWQTSEGSSILQAGTVRLRRRPSRGLGGSATYTWAKSIDNASSIGGGGGTVVAQDDRNLEAERGLSSFDRRHQFSADVQLELPFGADRRWLTQGGVWAALAGDWSVTAGLTAQSGTPLTARVLGSVTEVARGTNGTLRANVTGAPIAIDRPTILRFFNTDAFAIPAPGTFGNAGRNTIAGPGSHQLDASLMRDVRVGRNQVMSVRLDATNVLNTVQYASIDTVVNSPTFGQVVSIRPMRSVRLNVRFRF